MQQQGWAGLANGELLRRAAADMFDVFVTADQNLQFQQNLSGAPLGVVVLVARSNALEDLLPLVLPCCRRFRTPGPARFAA